MAFVAQRVVWQKGSGPFLVENIAKGTTNPGTGCFNQVNNWEKHPPTPQDSSSLLQYTNTSHIAEIVYGETLTW